MLSLLSWWWWCLALREDTPVGQALLTPEVKNRRPWLMCLPLIGVALKLFPRQARGVPFGHLQRE